MSSVSISSQPIPRRTYISLRVYSNDIFSYTPTNEFTGVIASLTPLTGSNCPKGSLLSENGKKLYPGVYPGVTTYMIGVFDMNTSVSGFIDPNSPAFTIQNPDRSYFIRSPGTDPVTGKLDLGPPIYTNGDVYLGGNIDISGNSILKGIVNTSNDLYVASNTYISGNLTVYGNTYQTGPVGMSNTLLVLGDTTLRSRLFVSGDTNLLSSLNVSSNSYLNGSVSMSNSLSVLGDTTLRSTLTVLGDTELRSTFTVLGGTTLRSTLTVLGDTELRSTFTVLGGTTLRSTLTVLGATTFSNIVTAQSNVFINGSLTGSSFNTENDIYYLSGTSISPSFYSLLGSGAQTIDHGLRLNTGAGSTGYITWRTAFDLTQDKIYTLIHRGITPSGSVGDATHIFIGSTNNITGGTSYGVGSNGICISLNDQPVASPPAGSPVILSNTINVFNMNTSALNMSAKLVQTFSLPGILISDSIWKEYKFILESNGNSLTVLVNNVFFGKCDLTKAGVLPTSYSTSNYTGIVAWAGTDNTSYYVKYFSCKSSRAYQLLNY